MVGFARMILAARAAWPSPFGCCPLFDELSASGCWNNQRRRWIQLRVRTFLPPAIYR